jgi:hypothetical protein
MFFGAGRRPFFFLRDDFERPGRQILINRGVADVTQSSGILTRR